VVVKFNTTEKKKIVVLLFKKVLMRFKFWGILEFLKIVIILKTVGVLNIFVDFFSKDQNLFEIEVFCNIINVFTAAFDTYNASLLY